MAMVLFTSRTSGRSNMWQATTSRQATASSSLDRLGTRYPEFFVMIRCDGDWRIDSQVFDAHSRA